MELDWVLFDADGVIQGASAGLDGGANRLGRVQS